MSLSEREYDKLPPGRNVFVIAPSGLASELCRASQLQRHERCQIGDFVWARVNKPSDERDQDVTIVKIGVYTGAVRAIPS